MSQKIIDFILKEIMKGKEITPIEKEFILESYPVKEIIVIGGEMGGDIFEVVSTDTNTITIKPLGTSTILKEKYDFENKKCITRRITNGKIVETVSPL